ncbi:hypothetical protein AT469_06930 [Klebsiella pneumoniae]|nr:hypothetical protein AT470_14285 [Klebsiella pneumoniae]PXL75422.1 hypothetical protein DMS96_29060 [Klebsiella variicola]KSV04773.1 hypothetical protein AT473_01190 [Klebsiella pneumoniae]KSV05395.1 hypothetical protein AT471_00985 [Klebsiella pneumoniae]KSV08820.1 hypothetical protein AT472_11855 [Klebsiella pneumoniae]
MAAFVPYTSGMVGLQMQSVEFTGVGGIMPTSIIKQHTRCIIVWVSISAIHNADVLKRAVEELAPIDCDAADMPDSDVAQANIGAIQQVNTSCTDRHITCFFPVISDDSARNLRVHQTLPCRVSGYNSLSTYSGKCKLSITVWDNEGEWFQLIIPSCNKRQIF